jgi:hypothetical protein
VWRVVVLLVAVIGVLVFGRARFGRVFGQG